MFPACEKENPAIVAMLLNHGATVNKICIQGWTALHEAVCRNNVEICDMLVKAGAKISIPNIYGITPIFVAAQSGNIDALRFLLKNGKAETSALISTHDEVVFWVFFVFYRRLYHGLLSTIRC